MKSFTQLKMSGFAIVDYLKIARFDHWTKHIFIIPGIVGSLTFNEIPVFDGLVYNILVGFISAGFIASGNYVINEWLDKEFDSHHPLKKIGHVLMATLIHFGLCRICFLCSSRITISKYDKQFVSDYVSCFCFVRDHI